MTAGLNVLCVCTHNRTRSVLMAGLLEPRLRAAGLTAVVSTAGFGPAGQPADEHAVTALADRGVDARSHVSSGLDDVRVAAADLIITAERFHVVQIGGRWRGSFTKTFTLPELVAMSESSWPPPHRSDAGSSADRVASWLEWIHQHRVSPIEYVDAAAVHEVFDPTGRSSGDWDRAISEIDGLTTRLAAVLRGQLT